MADISSSEIKKEIAAILKDADLDKTSSKKVRQQLEEKLECDLSSRKKEIDDLVMEYVESQQDEEEEKEETEESEEEKKPKAKPTKKKEKESSEEDQNDVVVTGEVQGKNPRRVAAGKKAASQMGHEKLSQIGKKGAESRLSGSSSVSASDEESGEVEEFENEEIKNPQRVAAGKKGAEVRRSGRTSRTGTSSDEGGRDSSEEGRGKDPKRVAAAKKAAETRKRKAQEAKKKASAEGEAVEPENKKQAASKMERQQVPVMEGEMYDERRDPEFNPASEREFIETEEPSRNPKQEEEEANREIQEQSRQMGIDPSKAGHETRTGLDYPTSQDRITKHKDEYIEKGEEDIPSVEPGVGKNPEQVAKGRKAAAGTTHEEFVERGKKGAEARWGKQQGSLARNQ